MHILSKKSVEPSKRVADVVVYVVYCEKKYALSCSLYDFSDFLALERVKNNFRNGLLIISFLMIALKQVHKIHILDDIKIIFFSFSH